MIYQLVESVAECMAVHLVGDFNLYSVHALIALVWFPGDNSQLFKFYRLLPSNQWKLMDGYLTEHGG